VKLSSLLAALTLCVAIVPMTALHAQTYPAKPITLTVPYPAGGPTDVLARTLANVMEKNLKQPMVVDNIAGAGGTVGAAKVARAPADGYTLLLHNLGMATSPSLYRKMPYNTEDLVPIGTVATVPMVLLAKNDMPAKNLAELVSYIKANPNKVNMGHSGIGSAAHLCGLLLQSTLHAKVTTVAYRGAGLAMTDLMTGQIDIMCEQVSSSASFVTTGKVKAYAVTAKQRLPILANVPTFTEGGIPKVDVGVWHGLYAPKSTPQAVIDRLAASLTEALRDVELQRKFTELTAVVATPAESKPESLRKLQTGEMERWAPIIKAAAEYAD